MLGRIDIVDPAGQHCHRAGLQRALVRCAIDAAGHAGDHHIAGLPKITGEAAGETLARRRGGARAHDGEGGSLKKFGTPTGPDHGRGRVECGEALGEAGFAGAEQACAQGFARFDLGQRLRLGRNARRAGRAAARGQRGQGGQGLCGRSIAVDQARENDGTHRLGSRQPQPGEPLGRSQRPIHLALSAPMRGSSPLSRRRMLGA